MFDTTNATVSIYVHIINVHIQCYPYTMLSIYNAIYNLLSNIYYPNHVNLLMFHRNFSNISYTFSNTWVYHYLKYPSTVAREIQIDQFVREISQKFGKFACVETFADFKKLLARLYVKFTLKPSGFTVLP